MRSPGETVDVQASNLTAGIDEVGRGAWAGPIYAGAVILDPDRSIEGLTDSKKLSARRREHFDALIRERALSWALGVVTAHEVDLYGVDEANFLAMRRAVFGLATEPARLLVDGHMLPEIMIPAEAVVSGDLLVPCISAASIIAKVARDREMEAHGLAYPAYGLERHKGYGTKDHGQALEAKGPCEIHRQSYKPVRKAAEKAVIAG